MNGKLALTAIVLFAVTLGLGFMSPALATQPDENGEHKMQICHFQEEKIIDNGDGTTTTIPAEWTLIDVDNKGKTKGHFDKNGDPRHVDPETGMGDFVVDSDETLAACQALLPEEEPDP